MKKVLMVLALAGLVVPTIAVPVFGADEPPKVEKKKRAPKKKKGEDKKEEPKGEKKKPS